MLYAVLLTSFYLLLFNILLYRFGMFQLPRLKPWLTLALFNLKFLAGVFSWAVYTFYYTDVKNNDVHKYYSDAVILQQYGVQNPLSFAKVMVGDDGALDARVEAAMKNWHRNFDEAPFNENRTVIKLNAFLLFFSFNTYFVHILFMCFISLIGIILLIQGRISPFIESKCTLRHSCIVFTICIALGQWCNEGATAHFWTRDLCLRTHPVSSKRKIPFTACYRCFGLADGKVLCFDLFAAGIVCLFVVSRKQIASASCS
jgi:hypothetical protein